MANDDNEAIPFERAILLMRRKLFPFIYNPHPWVAGNSALSNPCVAEQFHQKIGPSCCKNYKTTYPVFNFNAGIIFLKF